jgi:hypothetical protein
MSTSTTPAEAPTSGGPVRTAPSAAAAAARMRPAVPKMLPSVPGGVDARLDEIRSVFAEHEAKIYKHRYGVQLHVGRLVGGTPTDPNVAEGWIRTKMGLTSEEAVTQAVEEVMAKRSAGGKTITPEKAMEEVARNRNLSGFKRNFMTPIARNMQLQAVERGVAVLTSDNRTRVHRKFTPEEAAERFGELFIESRQIKAMIKEAAMISVGAGNVEAKGWGKTRKSMLNFLVEHLFVPGDEVLLGETDPSYVNQSFVHTWRGSGIKLEEVIENAVIDFELWCDYDFTEMERDFFKTIFVVGQQNGLGASRSQGFGRFKVTKFEKL